MKKLLLTGIIDAALIVLLLMTNSKYPQEQYLLIGLEIFLFLKVFALFYMKRSRVEHFFLNIFFTVLMFVWELGITRLNVLNSPLFPSPEEVISVFLNEYKYLLKCIWESMKLIIYGYMISVPIAVIAGVVIGWKSNIRKCVMPIIKVLSSIPPIICAPYIIAITPSFRFASIMIITISMLWPILMRVSERVEHIDNRVLNSLAILELSVPSVIFNVLVPYVFPSVIYGTKTSHT